jgi:hypothetical protein
MTFEVGNGDYDVTAIANGTDLAVVTLTVENLDADDLDGVSVELVSSIKDLNDNVLDELSTNAYVTPAP